MLLVGPAGIGMTDRAVRSPDPRSGCGTQSMGATQRRCSGLPSQDYPPDQPEEIHRTPEILPTLVCRCIDRTDGRADHPACRSVVGKHGGRRLDGCVVAVRDLVENTAGRGESE